MHRRLVVWTAVWIGWAAIWIAAPGAQVPETQGRPGKGNWMTDGGDPQRTAWQRNETLISKDSYAASWDGRLRKLDVATGNEIEPPEPWMPPKLIGFQKCQKFKNCQS